jgi:hypothetical protein
MSLSRDFAKRVWLTIPRRPDSLRPVRTNLVFVTERGRGLDIGIRNRY